MTDFLPVSAVDDTSCGVIRTRGTRRVTKKYGRNACARCKTAKVRCEGSPICDRCVLGNLDCIRGPDTRKLLSKDQERSMRHQNEALKAQVSALGNTVDSLNAELSSLRAQLATASSPSYDGQIGISSSLQLQQSPPQLPSSAPESYATASSDDESEDSDAPLTESDYETDHAYLLDGEGRNNNGGRDLFREYGQLYLYGLTSPFRLYLRHSRSHSSLCIREEEDPVRKERHVLVLPGLTDEDVQPHCSCRTNCWATALPPDAPISRFEHDQILERFFVFYSPWCMRVIPEYFLRDMFVYTHPPSIEHAEEGSKQPPTTSHYSPFLHLCLLAVATAFSDDPRVCDVNFRRRFVEAAKVLIEQECAHPSISAVQGLSLLGSFYSGLGEQTLGFVYFGMSARLCQALGLGSDCEHWVEKGRIRTRDLFDRYWAFHMECAQDACWALYVGREFGIPSGQSDPFLLGRLADPILDTMGWRRQGQESQSCQSLTIFLWSCSLMKISRRIMHLTAALAQPNARDAVKLLVAEIDMQLSSWREELPPALKLNPGSKKSSLPVKWMMHLAFNWLLILLHRPFFRSRRAPDANQRFSADRCTLAAKEIITILRSWKALYGTIRFAPITLIQVVFAAGTVFLLLAHQASSGRRIADQKQADALERVSEIIDFMKELGQSWSAALKIVDIFEKLLEVQRQHMHEAVEASKARKSARQAGRSRQALTEGALNASPSMTSGSMTAPPDNELQAPLPDQFFTHQISSSSVSDGGSVVDEPGMSPTPPFFEQLGFGNQGMYNALDLLINSQYGFQSNNNAAMLDFAGTSWSMPSGDALSVLPFMAPNSPPNHHHLERSSSSSSCVSQDSSMNFSPDVVDNVALTQNSFLDYPPYTSFAPFQHLQYQLGGMGPGPSDMPMIVGDANEAYLSGVVNDADDQRFGPMIEAMNNEVYNIY